MSGLVVDASVVMAWLFDDEDDPRADAALDRLVEEGALVPQLWHMETRNSLLTAERSKRLSVRGATERLDALKGLPIRTDVDPDFQSAFDLARAHELSIYDALYLELAREGERGTRDPGRGTQPGCRSRRGSAIGPSLTGIAPVARVATSGRLETSIFT